jgi:hypothetical protein
MTGWILAACCSGRQSPDRLETGTVASHPGGSHSPVPGSKSALISSSGCRAYGSSRATAAVRGVPSPAGRWRRRDCRHADQRNGARVPRCTPGQGYSCCLPFPVRGSCGRHRALRPGRPAGLGSRRRASGRALHCTALHARCLPHRAPRGSTSAADVSCSPRASRYAVVPARPPPGPTGRETQIARLAGDGQGAGHSRPHACFFAGRWSPRSGSA